MIPYEAFKLRYGDQLLDDGPFPGCGLQTGKRLLWTRKPQRGFPDEKGKYLSGPRGPGRSFPSESRAALRRKRDSVAWAKAVASTVLATEQTFHL